MIYAQIEMKDLGSPLFLMSPRVDQGVWLLLLRYCVAQENGGFLDEVSSWDENCWRTVVGISIREVKRKSALWSWEGGGLRIKFYPLHSEKEFCSKRKGGKTRAEQLKTIKETGVGGVSRTVHTGEQGGVHTPLNQGLHTGEQGGVHTPLHSGMYVCKDVCKESTRASSPSEDPDPHIPSLQEVRVWAQMSGVSTEYAESQWKKTNEDHGWVKNGQLIKWQHRFMRYWSSDRENWVARRNKNGGANGNANKNTRIEELRALLLAGPDDPEAPEWRIEMKTLKSS